MTINNEKKTDESRCTLRCWVRSQDNTRLVFYPADDATDVEPLIQMKMWRETKLAWLVASLGFCLSIRAWAWRDGGFEAEKMIDRHLSSIGFANQAVNLRNNRIKPECHVVVNNLRSYYCRITGILGCWCGLSNNQEIGSIFGPALIAPRHSTMVPNHTSGVI
jgi:hypothetical protein